MARTVRLLLSSYEAEDMVQHLRDKNIEAIKEQMRYENDTMKKCRVARRNRKYQIKERIPHDRRSNCSAG